MNTSPEHRQCAECGEVKPLADFPLRYGKHARYCAACRDNWHRMNRARKRREDRAYAT